MTKKNTHPTLSQVAREAGVGTTTVSRVINGGERVSPETLAHVRRVIESLGYMPNQAARTLKGQRTKTIGLIIPSIADPFFSSCAEAAQAIARNNDSLLIVTTTQNDPRTELDSLKVLIRHRVDGLLIVPANSQSPALRDVLVHAAMPIITIDRPLADTSIASVVVDNYKGAITATKHLIDHGYKRIACLTGESALYTLHERIRGYRKAMETAHLPCILDASVKDYKSAEYAILSLLDGANPPDAIFSTKNSTTIFAFEVLQRFNIRVPDTVALLGFDDFELASTLRPSISVIQQPAEEIGRRSAELLFDLLLTDRKAANATGARTAKRLTLETRLIQRSSCGCTPPAI
ncbi:LacI family DNA-binding transcriptional regulator [Acidicapsa dinghuensis]|uniref:LacI family DNA-binding transcriptional regulator n=1 Tax=Acidicapsa dinghuensis TaxID=2218256 RepID=A0ABW1EH47_9BACT|nr:LacI family DNA-binding transcriptional regulator [Acidicapsa dinghuensis]